MESQNRGIPWLADLPWFGVPFRRVEETTNEVELLIMVTPEFIEASDPEELPPCGPGRNDHVAQRRRVLLPRLPGSAQVLRGRRLPASACKVAGNAARRDDVHPHEVDSTRQFRRGRRVRSTGPQRRTRHADAPGGSRPNGQRHARAGVDSRRSAGVTKPTMIGPVGYDELEVAGAVNGRVFGFGSV